MRTLRPLSKQELKTAYKAVYKEAFPSAELKPLWAMEHMAAKGLYRSLGLFEDGEPIGYASLWLAEGDYVLLDYFVVPKEKRCAGIGAYLLGALLDCHPAGTVLMIESEAPTGDPAEDVNILRRLAFYERCGAVQMGFDSALFGVHYKVFALSRAPVDEAEVLSRYAGLYRRDFDDKIWKRSVRIPLAEGEVVTKSKTWGG